MNEGGSLKLSGLHVERGIGQGETVAKQKGNESRGKIKARRGKCWTLIKKGLRNREKGRS